MAETFILAEICANEFQQDAVAGFATVVHPLLEAIDGFRSLTLWRAAEDEERFLLLSHYADPEAAAAGLRMLADGHLLTDYIDSMTTPPDVRQVEVLARDGVAPGKVEPGGHLSISTQSPSDEEAGRQDLEDVLAGLLYLPGCLGTAHGDNVACPGELIGLAFWADQHAYEASISDHPTYPVRLFRRVV